jgi:hypothetical protein
MKLVAANPNPRVAGQAELPGKVNYFIGNDPDKWRTNIPTYAKVKYRDVYPGVDLVYYGNQRQLEFDLVVAPGTDPKTIRLTFDGLVGARHAVPLQLDDAVDLIIPTDGGEVRLHNMPPARRYGRLWRTRPEEVCGNACERSGTARDGPAKTLPSSEGVGTVRTMPGKIPRGHGQDGHSTHPRTGHQSLPVIVQPSSNRLYQSHKPAERGERAMRQKAGPPWRLSALIPLDLQHPGRKLR